MSLLYDIGIMEGMKLFCGPVAFAAVLTVCIFTQHYISLLPAKVAGGHASQSEPPDPKFLSFWQWFVVISHPYPYQQTLPARSRSEQVISCPAVSLTLCCSGTKPPVSDLRYQIAMRDDEVIR